MDFEARFPELYQFIGAWFPDADFEDLEAADVVRRFVLVSGPAKAAAAAAEARDLLTGHPELLAEIGDLANRYFETDAEAGDWLGEVAALLESAAEGPARPQTGADKRRPPAAK